MGRVPPGEVLEVKSLLVGGGRGMLGARGGVRTFFIWALMSERPPGDLQAGETWGQSGITTPHSPQFQINKPALFFGVPGTRHSADKANPDLLNCPKCRQE